MQYIYRHGEPPLFHNVLAVPLRPIARIFGGGVLFQEKVDLF